MTPIVRSRSSAGDPPTLQTERTFQKKHYKENQSVSKSGRLKSRESSLHQRASSLYRRASSWCHSLTYFFSLVLCSSVFLGKNSAKTHLLLETEDKVRPQKPRWTFLQDLNLVLEDSRLFSSKLSISSPHCGHSIFTDGSSSLDVLVPVLEQNQPEQTVYISDPEGSALYIKLSECRNRSQKEVTPRSNSKISPK